MKAHEVNFVQQAEELVGLLGNYGIRPNAAFASRLALFARELVLGNERTQLISRNDESRIFDRHLRESLAPVAVFDFLPKRTIMDLGSGGGLPGVPLALLFPQKEFVLIESKRKKCLFLRHVVQTLELDNVRVIEQRAETFTAEVLALDVVIARAVAALPVLWRLAAPWLGPRGVLLAMKGGNCQEEIDATLKLEKCLNVATRRYPNDFVSQENKRLLIIVSRSDTGRRKDWGKRFSMK